MICSLYFLKAVGFVYMTNFFSSVLSSEITSEDVITSNDTGSDTNDALFLTPLLERGAILEAQNLSRVRPDIGNTTSYSGYFTVDPECESNLFFWFFHAQTNWEESPVILWLQGGPGYTSLYGLFEEIGPISYKDGNLTNKEFSWNRKNNLLFIDQPAGTGFSFTGKGCFATNENDVAINLYSALLQFYQLFPSLQNNPFFISGESFAGHYIPALGLYIHEHNPCAKNKINLGGMMIGNGWMDAYYQRYSGTLLFDAGLCDYKQKDIFNNKLEEFRQYLRREEWEKAVTLFLEVNDLAKEIIGDVNLYNYLQDKLDLGSFADFLDSIQTRSAIHVGNLSFTVSSDAVFDNLSVDGMQSIKIYVEKLLEHYPMVFYIGQLDIACSYPYTINFFNVLQWSGAAEYQEATRQLWCVDGQFAGYYKGSNNLYEVLVRKAGHMVPQDQPFWALTLVESVTTSSPDDPLQGLSKC